MQEPEVVGGLSLLPNAGLKKRRNMTKAGTTRFLIYCTLIVVAGMQLGCVVSLSETSGSELPVLGQLPADVAGKKTAVARWDFQTVTRFGIQSQYALESVVTSCHDGGGSLIATRKYTFDSTSIGFSTYAQVQCWDDTVDHPADCEPPYAKYAAAQIAAMIRNSR